MKITKTEDSKVFLLRLGAKDFDSRGIVKEFALLGHISEFIEKQILMGLKKQVDVDRGLVLNRVSADLVVFGMKSGKGLYLRFGIRRGEFSIWNVTVEVNSNKGWIGKVSLGYM